MAPRRVVALEHLPLRPGRVLLWWWMCEVSWKVWGATSGVLRGATYAILGLLAATAIIGLLDQKQMEPVFKED